MHRVGHLGVALAFAAAPVSILLAIKEPEAAFIFSLLTVGMCRIPDQAEWIVPGIPHRMVIHNFVFLFAADLVVIAVTLRIYSAVDPIVSLRVQLYVAAPVGATAGILSHFTADALTKASGKYAVRPFWPFSK